MHSLSDGHTESSTCYILSSDVTDQIRTVSDVRKKSICKIWIFVIKILHGNFHTKNIFKNCNSNNKRKILSVDKISLTDTDQNNRLIMSLALPGMKAPEFSGMTTGPKGHKEMSLKDFTSNGSLCLLIFYPMDFGYISPSELLALNSIKKDLDNLKCNLLACSTDTAVIHNKGGPR